MRSTFFRLLVLSALIGISYHHSFGIEPYVPRIVNPLSESWRWKHFPELEGKGIRDIAEGLDGRAWMGVDDGVFEYDGYKWKLHNINENGLGGTPIEKVYVTDKGVVYAMSSEQIYMYRSGTWQEILSESSGYAFDFTKVIELSDESLMLSCRDGVLHLHKSGKQYFYTASDKINDLQAQGIDFDWVRFPEVVLSGESFSNVSDIIQDSSGKVWTALTFGHKGKLLHFNLLDEPTLYITEYGYYASNHMIEFGEEQKLIETTENEIWVINTSYKTPINVFSNQTWKSIYLSEKFGGDEYAIDIVQTNDGTVWIGALGKLYACKNDEWKKYEAPAFKIPANKLQLYKNSENKLWISGFMSKVYLVDYSSDTWLSYDGLNYQCESSPLEQWFIDSNGNAVSKTGERWISWGVKDGFIDAPVKIIVTKRNQIWAAGSHEGIAATAYLKNGKWHKQMHPHLSWGIDYRAIFEAADGSIWFGASVDAEEDKGQYSGVLQLTDPTATSLEWVHHKFLENGLKQSNCYGIGQTPDGRIWIGGSSLYFYDGYKWEKPENERLRQFVNVVVSTEHMLIVGSRYYGIFIYDGNTWTNYTSESGLTNNTIISINAIADDDIWVATENDICHFDGHHWQSNVFPSQMIMDFEGGDLQYSSDGSIWINLSDRNWKRRAFSHSKSQQSIYKNFVTHKHVPDQIPPETNITFYSSEVSVDGNTMIQWDGEDFFAATPNEKLSFSYRLNGGAWSPFSSERHHTFLSLASGDYQLEVRAMDLESNIDLTPAKIQFAVKPPVWKQAWFIALVSVFLLIISIFGFKIFTKNKTLEKLNASLKKVNKTIKSQNEEILVQQELIIEQKLSLQSSNEDLEIRNHKIQIQRDQLEDMILKVEELSKAKLNFFTNISHELRTPLSLILGPINQLRDPKSSLAEHERKKLYDIVDRNAARLLKLINQLLEIRNIENSTLSLKLREIDLDAFLFNITGLFHNVSKKRQIPLYFNSTIKGFSSFLDPDKIEKIVVNLLSNAFKHTPSNGEIYLSLEKVSADHHPALKRYQDYFLIKVKDTGKGIAADEMDHIFDRYFHKESIIKDEKSNGIGLSYIKDLVEMHEGQIQVDSTLDVGTVFSLYLPVRTSQQDSEEESYSDLDFGHAQQEIQLALAEISEELEGAASQNTFEDTEKPRILVVDDNPDMLTFIEGLLSHQYQVVVSESGTEAFKIAKNHTLDLVISDVMMPVMDGIELCTKLKSDFATSHIPVILLTAKCLEHHQIEGYEVGAENYITKPFNPKILELKIRNILKQKKSLHTKISRDFKITPQEVQLTSPDELMLNKLVDLMEKNADNSAFNVNAMCESMNLSHMHFIRKVKQLTGKRPIDLLKSFRMKRAKDLLSQNKLSISEVAYMVGFEMPSSFSRAFKKEFGYTPSEYMTG